MPSSQHVRALQALSFMDLTTLNNNDNRQTIETLCEQAIQGSQHVAAVCVFPEWVAVAKQCLDDQEHSVKVATVTNFPDGGSNVDRAAAETERAIAAGADEVDVVLPYQSLLKGDESTPSELVRECKDICGESVALKVIIESGRLERHDQIVLASEIAIANGADFIKTSTGKVPVNATLKATEAMLGVIKSSKTNCGFKAAGGIKTVEEAVQYMELAEQIMGADWVTPEHFRIGASSLLKAIQNTLSQV